MVFQVRKHNYINSHWYVFWHYSYRNRYAYFYRRKCLLLSRVFTSLVRSDQIYKNRTSDSYHVKQPINCTRMKLTNQKHHSTFSRPGPNALRPWKPGFMSGTRYSNSIPILQLENTGLNWTGTGIYWNWVHSSAGPVQYL